MQFAIVFQNYVGMSTCECVMNTLNELVNINKKLVQKNILFNFRSLASAQVKYSHDVAVAKVQAAGIPIWSSGGCSDRYNPSCTSLEQVNANSIDSGSGGITVFKSASGCPVTITGGTEVRT